MTMNCRDIEANLLRIVEGEVTVSERKSLDEHLRGCAACRELVALYESAISAAATEDSESTESLWRSVQSRLNQIESTRRPSAWIRRPVVITVFQSAALAVAVWLGVTLGSTPNTTVADDEGSELVEYYATGFFGASVQLDDLYRLSDDGGGQ